jgi:hypothetical protein
MPLYGTSGEDLNVNGIGIRSHTIEKRRQRSKDTDCPVLSCPVLYCMGLDSTPYMTKLPGTWLLTRSRVSCMYDPRPDSYAGHGTYPVHTVRR